MEVVEEVMAAVPTSVGVNCTVTGFEALKKGRPVEPRRWVQPADHDIHLADLSEMRRGDPRVRRQWEAHQAARAARIAGEATGEPPSEEDQ